MHIRGQNKQRVLTVEVSASGLDLTTRRVRKIFFFFIFKRQREKRLGDVLAWLAW